MTELTETATTVTVTINIFEVGLGGTAAGYPTVVLVHLRDPIAGRTVVNGDTGQAIDRRLCPGPPEPDTAFGCP